MRTSCTGSELDCNSDFDLLSLQGNEVRAIDDLQELSEAVNNFTKLSAETYDAIARHKAAIAELQAATEAARAADKKVEEWIAAKRMEQHGCLS